MRGAGAGAPTHSRHEGLVHGTAVLSLAALGLRSSTYQPSHRLLDPGAGCDWEKPLHRSYS